MPPKKKSASKKPAKSRTPPLIDGLTKEEMSKEQLKEHIVRLREELEREREERNYFQLERDKIHSFWGITDRQLEERKAERKNLDKDLEDDERHHQVEIKVYKQKMKHLLCEHQNTISELKADDFASTEVLHKQQEQLETEIHKEMRTIKEDIQSLDHESLVKELKLRNDEETTKARNSWEKKLTESKAERERMMELLLKELDTQKNEKSEWGRNYRGFIASLKEDNSQVLSEAAAFISHMQQNLDTCDLLQIQLNETEMARQEMKKDLAVVLQENKCLSELFLGAEEENKKCEKEWEPFETEKNNYELVKTDELNNLTGDYEALMQIFSKLQKDELCKTVPQIIKRVQQKAGEKSIQHKSKLEAQTDSLEKMQTLLSLILSDPNMDQTALRGITNKIEEKLDSYYNSIKNCQYEKAQISKASKDFELTYAVEGFGQSL